MNRRLVLLLTFIWGFCAIAISQEIRDSVAINFRQSKVKLDTTYMQNREALVEIAKRIEIYNDPDSAYVLSKVSVIGAASPEGSVKFNEWLSHERADRIFRHIGRAMNLPDSIMKFEFVGRDWRGLRSMVLDDEEVPFRDDVLQLLNEIIDNVSSTGGFEKEDAGNINKIKHLHGGKPYLYMYNKLFPALRASKLMLTFSRCAPRIRPLAYEMTEFYLPSAEVETPSSVGGATYPVIIPCSPFYMGIKSNMVYDALAVPEIGAEFYLGKNFSIVGNWMYGWWKTDRRHRYWRAYGGDLALRYWFGREAADKPLTGHHVGVYGGVFTYDFEWGGKGYLGGVPGGSLWDKCNVYGGFEYGYSLPIARRWNIDFTLGLGYLGGEYREYIPIDNHYVWQATKKRNYFGPTKAEVSIVWLIGCDNYNRKYSKLKGGKR